MSKKFLIGLTGLVLLLINCNDSNNNPNTQSQSPVVPAPSGLTSVGTLNNISLSWNPQADVTGFNVYKSSDGGAAYAKLTSDPITDTSYSDPISSPEGDGVVYYYYVTAVSDTESGPSDIVRNVHGTRLSASYSSGCTLDTGGPYVAEGTVAIEGDDLYITSSTVTRLYIFDNAVIDIEQGHKFNVSTNGFVYVLASTSAPARFTSHKAGGGSLNDGEGFALRFYDCAAGVVIQNTIISNIQGGSGAVSVNSCSPTFKNLYITANRSNGTSYFDISGVSSAPIIEHDSFTNMVVAFQSDLRGTAFKMEYNRIRNGYYAIEFANADNVIVDAGQIVNNDIDCTSGNAYAFNVIVSGGGTIPLGGNYWHGGSGSPPEPPVQYDGGTNVTFDFTTPLSSAPDNVGPNW